MGPLGRIIDTLEDEPYEHNFHMVVVGDQEKAFERVGHNWLDQMLRNWRFPTWVCNIFRFLVMWRSIRAIIAGQMGAPRILRRGIGMGEPASPFLWTICFDPIVLLIVAVSGCVAPTFVDDVALFVKGSRHAARTQFALLATTKAVGLAVTAH